MTFDQRPLDDFIDLILDVMSAANELMMDRLAQVCQKMLGRFGKCPIQGRWEATD
jgi:hypothetical protein